MELRVEGFEWVGNEGEAQNRETGHFLILEQTRNGGVLVGFGLLEKSYYIRYLKNGVHRKYRIFRQLNVIV